MWNERGMENEDRCPGVVQNMLYKDDAEHSIWGMIADEMTRGM